MEHSENTGIHKCAFPKYGVTFHFDHVADRRGEPTAEVRVVINRDAKSFILGRNRLVLTSLSGKATWLRHLKGYEDYRSVPWREALEQACMAVLEHSRKAEPPIILDDVNVSEELEYLVRPLLVENQANIIYGDGGTGKSTLAAYLAVMMSLGHPSANGIEVKPSSVLVLDYEWTASEWARRTRAIEAGLGYTTPMGISYRFCSSPLVHEVEYVQKIVNDENINLIIVDPLGSAVDGNIREEDSVLSYFRALRSFSCTTLSIHHENKNPESKDKMYGNRYIRNQARNVWQVSSSQEPGESEMVVGLFHRKINSNQLMRPMGLRFMYRSKDEKLEEITVGKGELRDEPGLKDQLSESTRILNALHDISVATNKELAQETGIPLASVVTQTGRLKRRRLIIEARRRGREITWGLAAHDN